MSSETEILTPRLRLRPLLPRDAAPTAAMMCPQISRYTGSWPARMEAADVLARIERHRREEADGLGVIRAADRQADGALIGWIGMQKSSPGVRSAELGYWIGLDHHGQGYATEAAGALMRWSFDGLDLDLVEAGAQLDNTGSIAVLRKLGMREVGTRTRWSSVRGADDVCLFFEMAREG